MRAPGKVEPVFYFLNCSDAVRPRGYILLAPDSHMPAPEGYTREFAETLPDIDRLERTLQAQERAEWEREAQHDERLLAERRAAVRDRLYARLTSSSTDDYEREFIRLYLQLREDKRARHQQRYLERTTFLWARHNDTPKGRGVDEERVSLDRVNF